MSPETEMVEPVKACYRCGHLMAADARKCPACGRRQYRICYCGQHIDVTAAECPHCGADWSASRRTRRSKQRSSTIKPAAMAKSAAIGAAVALALMGISQILVRYFARIGADAGVVPVSMSEKLSLARVGVHKVAMFWVESISSRSDALLGIGIGLLVGAGIGVTLYLINIGTIRIQRKKKRSGRQSSRRRRA